MVDNEAEITLKIRQGTSESFEVSVKASCTVKDLKVACEESSKLQADNMRLIFKGKQIVTMLIIMFFQVAF
jgi:hypothetical protein